MPECRNLTFLGRFRIEEDVLSADMFAFHTLSERLAGSVLEALGAGCPVITTKCAGIDTTDGAGG